MLDAAPQPLVQVEGLKMYFPIRSGLLRIHTGDVKAVDGVSFSILPGFFGFTSRPPARW
jgi:oligopeptide transport system ATP-binding protein